ncbi:hypothetical protein [uncultured Methanolobus sp.]|uniref:hypothetical protein n=1 Tax=uncultured Methanolobus sp. TaxID=218300 RepID=UPI002AAC37F3|nr:hypothetical protein [uncultured Methanolobus sp.]
MTETNGNGNGTGNKLTVPFMGGQITIKEGGSFNDKDGKLVEYGPVVDVSSIADTRRRVEPAIFKNMVEAVSKHPEAMKMIISLS